MWFFGGNRGVEVICKIYVLQDLAAGRDSLSVTKETHKQLYDILTSLDTKATGLLAVNAFFIAGLVALFPCPDKSPEVIGVTPPMWL